MSRHKSPMPERGQRIADQIQRDLAEIIQREMPPARAGLITLTGVEITPDYAHAKVFFTTLGAEPEIAHSLLSERSGYFHSLLFKRLHIHTVPTLHFVHDASVAHGADLSRLIDVANATRAKD